MLALVVDVIAPPGIKEVAGLLWVLFFLGVALSRSRAESEDLERQLVSEHSWNDLESEPSEPARFSSPISLAETLVDESTLAPSANKKYAVPEFLSLKPSYRTEDIFICRSAPISLAKFAEGISSFAPESNDTKNITLELSLSTSATLQEENEDLPPLSFACIHPTPEFPDTDYPTALPIGFNSLNDVLADPRDSLPYTMTPRRSQRHKPKRPPLFEIDNVHDVSTEYASFLRAMSRAIVEEVLLDGNGAEGKWTKMGMDVELYEDAKALEREADSYVPTAWSGDSDGAEVGVRKEAGKKERYLITLVRVDADGW